MAKHLAHRWWAVSLRGAVELVFGLIALGSPGITLAMLMVLFGAWALGDGVLALFAAWRAHDLRVRWWGLLLEGLAGLALGLVVLAAPSRTAVAFVYVVSAWAVLTGVLEMATARALRREVHGEWALAAGGVVSIALGVLLAARPLATTGTLVWMLGGYSILFGALVFALSLRLRRFGRGGEEAPLGRTRDRHA